ncbi:MAG: hypothetical protein GYA47_06670 [Desulfovibrio sp.]|nr:hypothetical protein [Desulfovibrio sp.]
MPGFSLATTRLPARTALAAIVGFVVLVFAGVALLYPVVRDSLRLSADIARESQRLEEQKALLPLYLEMKKIVDKGAGLGIPPAETAPLPLGKVQEVAALFEECAISSGAQTYTVTPDPDSLARGAKSLSVRVVLRGEPEDFRKFLAAAGRLSSLETIETIRAKRVSEGYDYLVVAWLALE